MELRLFGPPGTGKTTRLAARIGKAAEKFGPNKIMVSSFTRAAAAEIAGRDLPIPPQNVGTLHSFAWRALGKPKIAEVNIKTWNEEHPNLSLVAQSSSLDEAAHDVESNDKSNGEQAYALLGRLRAQMIPEDRWPQPIREFNALWSGWKSENEFVDFTDLLERAAEDTIAAPGFPLVGFFDEAQDFTRLQVSLLRKWAERMEYFLMAGDDDQLLYGFAGATPDVLTHPVIDSRYKEILNTSYRVPVAVHAVANPWIQRIVDRETKDYLPRGGDPGSVARSRSTLSNPGGLLHEIRRTIGDGKTFMLLAACEFQTHSTCRMLHDAGVPFHNPFRVKNGRWNPLPRRGKKGAFGVLLSYLRPELVISLPFGEDKKAWSIQQLAAWASILRSKGVLRKGAKAWLDVYSTGEHEFPTDEADYIQHIHDTFEEEAANAVTEMVDDQTIDMEWLFRNALDSKAQSATFQLAKRQVEAGGVESMEAQPQVIVGTIHSVKGGEADTVALFPDLSAKGARAWATYGPQRDSIIRQYYVGMTRARERLLLCSPSGRAFVKI